MTDLDRNEQDERLNHAVDLRSIPFPQESEATVAPVESVEQETTLMLRTVLKQIDDELQQVYDQSELNEARIEILKALSLAHSHGCTQVELANSLGQSEANISAMVSRMRRDGWIYRVRSQADRRKSNLMLTSKSLQILGDVHQQINQKLERLFASLEKTECRQLANLLGKLHIGLTLPQHPAAAQETQHPVAG
ncbi:MAG: winged helix-turn-helix transcriptional regulator [Planctomycetaceae bacterium]|nr:winged helix-turn-helix transcriptional regulator [Planctomycetaceae bacterium]